MRTKLKTWIFVAVGLAAGCACASARPLEAELPLKQAACFERAYDEAHLSTNPQQKVTRVRLLYFPNADVGETKNRIYVELMMTLRKRRAGGDRGDFDYSLTGFCKPAKGAQAFDCANEWDAGAWRLERMAGGLMVRNKGLIMNPDNYDSEDISDDAVTVPPQPDDKAWALKTADPKGCDM